MSFSQLKLIYSYPSHSIDEYDLSAGRVKSHPEYKKEHVDKHNNTKKTKQFFISHYLNTNKNVSFAKELKKNLHWLYLVHRVIAINPWNKI
jgi:hypothetical protein